MFGETKIFAICRAVARLLRSSSEWRQAVSDLLAVAAREASAGRAHVTQIESGPEGTPVTSAPVAKASRRFEWRRSGYAPHIDDPELHELDLEAAGFGRWLRSLAVGEPIHGPVSELPVAERLQVSRLGVGSLAVLPIEVAGELWGLVGFEVAEADRRWSRDDLAVGELVAEALASRIERSRLESALERSEESYQRLFEDAADCVFTHDELGRITSISRGGALLTGYSHRQLIGKSAWSLIAPEDREMAKEMAVKKLSGGAQATSYEATVLTKLGKRLRVELSTWLIRPAGRLAVQGVARNVTERRKLEERLHRAQRMEAMGRLAGGVAHDFNNLLTVINGNSSQLLDSLGAADPRRTELQEIAQAGEQAALLTRQLLAFSRQQVMLPRALDLNRILAESQAILRRLLREDVELVTELAPDVGAVRADPGQVEQVIINLVLNARDAMPEGGQVILQTSQAQLTCDDSEEAFDVVPGSYVLLAVRDTGVGIDEEAREHLFEPFFTTKALGHGTGLGLSTVYGIVKQCGGYIFVDSEVGRGTCFRAYFPSAEESIERLEPARPAVATTRGSETVLLVEDNEMVCEMTCRALESGGYRVLAAADFPQALEASKRFVGIDLLLTDVVLPGGSGKDLARVIVDQRPGVKVLFMSGYTDQPFDQAGPLIEGSRFLQKPFAPRDLLAAIREMLDRAGD